MERHFDDELETLKTKLLRMATMTEQAIHRSIEALKALDAAAAEACIQDDRQIDELENAIEEDAIELLALFQPMAKDLRYLTMALRINAELERIADLSVNISQRVLDLSRRAQPLLKPLVDIPRLNDIAKWMVRSAIDSFVRNDENLAREVILKDQEANELRTAIITELVDDYMVKDGKTSPRAVPLLLVARDLERICDHASAIAEDVIYMIQAKMVKHHPERLQAPDEA